MTPAGFSDGMVCAVPEAATKHDPERMPVSAAAA
jgi:hypothetical protein